jgi:hypothetical protein
VRTIFQLTDVFVVPTARVDSDEMMKRVAELGTKAAAD